MTQADKAVAVIIGVVVVLALSGLLLTVAVGGLVVGAVAAAYGAR